MKQIITDMEYIPVMIFHLHSILSENDFQVKRMHRQAKLTGGSILMEEDDSIPWDSYAIKLHKVERRIKELNFSEDSPLLKQEAGDDVGYASDEEFPADDGVGVGDYKQARKKRLYPFKRSDFRLTLLLCAVWILSTLFWLPTQAVAYLWALDWQNPPPDVLIITTATLPVVTLAMKPLFYVVHGEFRMALKKALPCKFKNVDIEGL